MRTLIALLLSLPLSGCFFIYIPGSVFDSMAGKEGQNCVGREIPVGGVVKLPDGSVGTVVKLEGESTRCKDEERPIRALVQRN